MIYNCTLRAVQSIHLIQVGVSSIGVIVADVQKWMSSNHLLLNLTEAQFIFGWAPARNDQTWTKM